MFSSSIEVRNSSPQGKTHHRGLAQGVYHLPMVTGGGRGELCEGKGLASADKEVRFCLAGRLRMSDKSFEVDYLIYLILVRVREKVSSDDHQQTLPCRVALPRRNEVRASSLEEVSERRLAVFVILNQHRGSKLLTNLPAPIFFVINLTTLGLRLTWCVELAVPQDKDCS